MVDLKLSKEVRVQSAHTKILFIDNLSAKNLTSNSATHAHVKHVVIDFHFIKDLVIKGLLDVRFTPFIKQVANPLIKPFSEPRFVYLRSKFMVLSPIYT